MKIDVLDKGHIQYMDHMGTDLTVVNAARVSFDKESEWTYIDEYINYPPQGGGDLSVVQRLSERDTNLINYLAEHEHWTPFGQCNLQLRIKMPIFVARQMMRSNIGIVWNEVSRRYVDSEPEFYVPDVLRNRPDKSMKQGSGSGVIENIKEYADHHEELWGVDEWMNHTFESISEDYRKLIKQGVCPEQARMVLPQSTYTEVVGNFTLAALARVYTQRADSHAQWEIQQYALAMGEVAKKYFPVSWEALTQ